MAKNITKGDIKKQDFLVLRQNRDQSVSNVIAPNGLQVGLTDDRFRAPLTVKGGIQVSDGIPYLLAGSNMLIETSSDGQVTLSTSGTAVRRTKIQFTQAGSDTAAGTDIVITGAGFNTINVTDTDQFIDVYHNNKLMVSGTVANVTAGTADYYVKWSTGTTLVFGFPVLVDDVIITSVIASGSSQTAAAGDALSLTNGAYHVNVLNTGGVEVTSDSLAIKTASGGAVTTTANGLTVKIDDLTTLSSGVDPANDKLLIYDATADALKAVAPNLIGAAAALDIASAGSTLNESTLASGDLLGVADVNDSNATKKITVEDFGQYLASGTNAGIGESSGKLTIDLNDLVSATVDVSADSIAIIDGGSSNVTRKESVADLVSGIAGTVTTTGLAASAGTLKVDITNVTSVGTLNSADQVLIYDADVGALRKTTINDIGLGAVAPPGAQYITLATDGTLSNERVLTAGDGIDITDGGAGAAVTIAADVTDFIDTSHGLKESSNNIQVALKSSGGLVFDNNEIKIDYGTSAGNSVQGTNTLTVTAGDGLKSGGLATLGNAASTIQLDIDPADFAGTGLRAAGDDLHINNSIVATISGSTFTGPITASPTHGITGSLTALNSGAAFIRPGNSNITITTGSDGSILVSATAAGGQAVGTITEVTGALGLFGGGTAGSVGLFINDGIVATLTGSIFSGHVGVTGSIHSTSDISGSLIKAAVLRGSLTRLENNEHYLLGGAGISISTGSNGQITISGAEGDVKSVTAGTGLSGGGTSGDVTLSINNSIVATLTGSVFSGHVGITGSLHSTAELSGSIVKAARLSGSLTTLENGNPYLVAGTGIALATGSNGQVTITGNVGDITGVTAGTGLSGGGNTGGVTLNINNSVVATLTGSVFSGHVGITGSLHSTAEVSGSIIKAPTLTGSLTKLEDGSSYLVAGSNITITSASNGSVTIASTNSGGIGIGTAEDGSYNDGLFTDFSTGTTIGTAVDRFNEVLKALAPDPAPDLDDIDCNNSDGTTAFLSFGSSNNQSSASPAYASSATAAGFSAIDVNSSYAAATSGNNIKKGIYNGSTVISGDLNEDVAQNLNNSHVNYTANAFGNGETGTLKLEVNGSLVHSIVLTGSQPGLGVPGSGTGTETNANSSGFINLSKSGSAKQSNGDAFPSFQHRTGRYQIGTADQRNGWNYARVVHTVGSNDLTTNYVEWVNDPNSDALAAAGNSINFTGLGSIHLSGVEYFQSGTIEYRSRVTNAYKYVYDNTNITFTIGNSANSQNNRSFSLAAQSKPTINTGAGETHAKILHLTSSAAITADYFLSGTITAGVNVTHPLKSDLSNAGQSSISPVLMYNLSNDSTHTIETFKRENFRLISGSYNAQSDVTDSNNAWNSTVYMTASNGGHSNGLQFFDQKLVSPINSLNSGNFSIFANGPTQNPNYSGQTGTRTFHRWFRNSTGSPQFDLSIAINGSGNIVAHGTTLDTSKITVLIKIPGKTGWMDLAETFVLDSVADNDGASAVTTVISKDSTLNATNYVNFGNISVANNGYVALCVKADESWTGNVSQITADFGAGTGTLSAVPNLDDIDCDQDGTDANLSFGSNKSISGYTDPTTAAGFSAANLNDLYETSANSNNLRRSIFVGSTTLEGDLNEDVSSPGNDYVANAFSDANSGSLKLEVNGSVVHTVEITGSLSLVGAGNPGSGTDTSLNSDGSGFISISNWAPGLFDNGVPRYSEIQRTAKYRIVAASQRTGWNYARVIHTVGGSDRETNYIEWVNDPNSDALSSAGNGLSIFGDNSFSYISGVKYFTSPSGSILTRVSNIYKNVYSDSSSAISFTSLTNCSATKIIQSGSGLTSTKSTSSATDSLQTLNTTANSQNQALHVSGTIDFSRSKSLPGTYTTAYSCAGAMVFAHPLKTNLTAPTQTTTNLLVWTPSDTSNANTNEYFTGETYRLVSGSYAAQSDVSGGSKNWNSQRSMNDQGSYPEHATGLLIYDTYLIPPKDGGSSGDFRNHDEGGGIESPAGNVNYSSGVLTNSNRDYFRSFRNNTSNDRASITITIYGDATIVGRSGANQGTLGANKNVFVEVSIPAKTGLLDLGKPSAGAGNYLEGDGCLSGDLDATIDGAGATNTCTFNGRTVDGTVSTSGEYIVIRISASKTWTGYIDRIAVSWS